MPLQNSLFQVQKMESKSHTVNSKPIYVLHYWTSQSLNNSAVYTNTTYLFNSKFRDALIESNCGQNDPNLHMRSFTIQNQFTDTKYDSKLFLQAYLQLIL